MPTGCCCRVFVDVVVFLLTILLSGQSVTSISLLYLKLWQFLIIRVLNGILPETAKKPCLNLTNIWGLGRVKDTKSGMNVSNGSYLMLQSRKVTVFTVFELLGKNSRGGGKISPITTTQIRIKEHSVAMQWLLYQSLSTGFTRKALHCKILSDFEKFRTSI